jgi:hypothetical protein
MNSHKQCWEKKRHKRELAEWFHSCQVQSGAKYFLVLEVMMLFFWDCERLLGAITFYLMTMCVCFLIFPWTRSLWFVYSSLCMSSLKNKFYKVYYNNLYFMFQHIWGKKIAEWVSCTACWEMASVPVCMHWWVCIWPVASKILPSLWLPPCSGQVVALKR